MSEPIVTLDVRDEIRSGNDPFLRIMHAVAELKDNEPLLVIAPFKPTPLLHLMTQKGFTHDAQPMIGGDWRVRFQRLASATSGAAAVSTANSGPGSCGCCATPTLEVDARGLEPPEPMVKILEALTTLPRGAELTARTDRRPMHLYAHLEHRGFAGTSQEQTDGSYVTLIQHT